MLLSFLCSQSPAIVIIRCWRWPSLVVWTISLKISARTINSLSEDHIDLQEQSLSFTVLVKNWQPEVCLSVGYLFLWETHYTHVESKCSLCCPCRLKTLTRKFLMKVLAGCPFQIDRDSQANCLPVTWSLLRCFWTSNMVPLKFLNMQALGHVVMLPWYGHSWRSQG